MKIISDNGRIYRLPNLLNAMDTLEGKLAKSRQVKVGMMQELLTGKVRLV